MIDDDESSRGNPPKRDEASLWLGKRGMTDSDRVKGDGESIKGVPISSNTLESIGHGNK